MIAETARQISHLPLRPGRALLVVDADEVLVHFARPFGAWLAALGWTLRLQEYRLDRAIRNNAGDLANPVETHDLIMAFIDSQTLHQPATEGAAASLAALSPLAQILVLTNVPLHRHRDRMRNLASLAMPYPVVVNRGPKGPALALLARRVTAPIAFIDDNPGQIDSAAVCAPDVHRVHFTGCDLVRTVLPVAGSAHLRPENWQEITASLTAYFA